MEENEIHEIEKAETKGSWWIEKYRSNEKIALFLAGLSLFVLLALISYSPDQLPEWASFSESTAADAKGAKGNFIGPVGATLAGYLFFAFGAASFLLPVVVILWGLQILMTKRIFGVRNFIALGVFMIAASCIVDCQSFFLQGWIEKYKLPGSGGGLFGQIAGNQLFVRLFGPVGTFIIMGIVSVLTLIVITGIHPFQFTRMVISRVIALIRGINWEQEWSIWSGMPPKEGEVPSYNQTTRILPAEVISVDEEYPEDDPTETEDVIYAGTVDDEDEGDLMSSYEEDLELDEEPIVEEVQVQEPVVVTPPPAAVKPKLKPQPAAPVPAPAPTVAKKVPNVVSFPQKHHQHSASKEEKKKDFKNSFLNEAKFGDYQLPPIDILGYAPDVEEPEEDDEVYIANLNLIVAALKSFKVDVEPGDITKGPTITRYELYPSPGLRVNKITALKDDLARATRAEHINILAPIPGKDTVGIEIANSKKITVALRELFESKAFLNTKAKLPLVLGKDVYGKAIIGDLAKMPHLLVAGATGSGKSVCINGIIASLIYRYSPDELKFIMIDPKVVEMQLYNRLPHMAMPVVTDTKKVLMALRWVIKEMEGRYAMFAKKGVRNFEGYNDHQKKEAQARADMVQPNLVNTETGKDFLAEERAKAARKKNGEDEEFPDKLPYVVVIIDELADLMQTAQADVEVCIARLAQKARAAGIHLVVATQTPRADVITGTIKANIPSRIAFQVSSKMDSRIILDENGAENLIGKGDMLFLPPRGAKLIRAQGALITDDEAMAVVEACASQGEPKFEVGLGESADFSFLEEEEEDEGLQVSDADEEVLCRCMEVIYTEKKASTSLFQRKLRLGYTRAARMVDILEARGVIGPGDGARPREILIELDTQDEAAGSF